MKNRAAITVALGSTQTLAWASSFYLPAVLATPMARDTGLSTPWVYAALSLGLGVSALLGPRVGHHIDARGGRGVICASNGVFAAGLLLLAAARGPVSLIGAWLVLGIAMAGGLYESAFAAVTRLYGYGSRAAITGITLIAGFASTVGWPISASLEHALGWRGTCLAWAALHVAFGLPLNAWALRHANRDDWNGLAPGRAASPADAPAEDRGMLILSFMFTAAGMVTIGMATNLPRLFVAIGATPAAAIAAASLLGPAQVAARLLEYAARRHINPLVSARVANTLHPLAALTVALGGVPVIAAFSIVHGAGSGMMTICRGTLPLALFGPAGYGARLGRINAPARTGQALAPFLFGLAIDRLGEATLAASCGLSLCALLALSWLTLPGTPSVRGA